MRNIPHKLSQGWMRFWKALEMQLEEELSEGMVYQAITSQWITILSDLKQKISTSYPRQATNNISDAALYAHLRRLEVKGLIEFQHVQVHPTTERTKSQCRRKASGGTRQTAAEPSGLAITN